MSEHIDMEVIRGLLDSSIRLNAQMVVASRVIQVLLAALDAPAKSSVGQAIRILAEDLLSQANESRHGIAEGALLSAEINRYLAAAEG